jgi:hypothetical protein
VLVLRGSPGPGCFSFAGYQRQANKMSVLVTQLWKLLLKILSGFEEYLVIVRDAFFLLMFDLLKFSVDT